MAPAYGGFSPTGSRRCSPISLVNRHLSSGSASNENGNRYKKMEELQAMAILINKYQLSAKIIPYHEQQRVGKKKAYRMRLSGGVAWGATIGFREISVKCFRGIVSTDLYKSPVHLDLQAILRSLSEQRRRFM